MALPGRQVACVRGPPDRLREGASVVPGRWKLCRDAEGRKLVRLLYWTLSVHTEDIPLQIHLGLFRKHPYPNIP
jgi:hypothetical protein